MERLDCDGMFVAVLEAGSFAKDATAIELLANKVLSAVRQATKA